MRASMRSILQWRLLVGLERLARHLPERQKDLKASSCPHPATLYTFKSISTRLYQAHPWSGVLLQIALSGPSSYNCD